MIRERAISPWLLLFSKQFKKFLVENVSTEQRVILETIIHPDRWAQIFEEDPDSVAIMKAYVRELEI